MEALQKQIKHLFSEYLREHVGVMRRHDICVGLEFLVWLKTRHPTLVNMMDDSEDQLCRIREWLGIAEQ